MQYKIWMAFRLKIEFRAVELFSSSHSGRLVGSSGTKVMSQLKICFDVWLTRMGKSIPTSDMINAIIADGNWRTPEHSWRSGCVKINKHLWAPTILQWSTYFWTVRAVANLNPIRSIHPLKLTSILVVDVRVDYLSLSFQLSKRPYYNSYKYIRWKWISIKLRKAFKVAELQRRIFFSTILSHNWSLPSIYSNSVISMIKPHFPFSIFPASRMTQPHSK